MSTRRCLASSTHGASKFAFALPPAIYHLPRNHLTYKQFRSASSKRELQTATAYRPHSLESFPPPPRNTSIPDTSIAGTIVAVGDARPPRLIGEHNAPPQFGEIEKQSVSVSEAEAQKSKPVAEGGLGAQSRSTSAAKSKRPKLRARKAAMTLTPTATEQLRNLLSQPQPKMIRVGVKNRGCSGLAYHLEYVDKAGTFDEAVEQDGVKVLIDSKALFSIIGSEMDWVEDKLNQRFVFRNPNISRSYLLSSTLPLSNY
ncbi:MAG: Iron-sulfur assembly protein 1 [Heterodermia speciosa]|uniref:Iron-sulfur assembly protein 1 n=1 Tax=Heterodermia speciosa TaxID=116794 RepID=A0A8H3F2Q6_9LECA|nr:MAG: Iron-sulfur assembly protein 1 [Heterodermia speciosa]